MERLEEGKGFKASPQSDVHDVERVSLGMKIGYAFGDFGANFHCQTVSIFLLYYFTDVFGISAVAAGSVIFFVKVWEALFDFVLGASIDRVRTRWGSKRPFLLFGALPLGISLFLLYATPPLSDPIWKVIYAAAAFFAVSTFYAVVNVPYSALTACLTTDSGERASLTAFRMAGAILGTLIVATATKPLVQFFADEAAGFRALGVLYGIAIAACSLVTFFSVRERAAPGKASAPRLRDIARVFAPGGPLRGPLRQNPLFLLFFGVFFLFASCLTFLGSVAYFFKYCVRNEAFLSVGFFCLYVPAAFALPVLVRVSILWGKKIMYLGGMGLFAAGTFALFFLESFSLPFFATLFVAIGFGLSAFYQGPWSMVPDTVEWVEWKSGLRFEGFIYGLFFFGVNCSTGLSSALVGSLLSLSGYVPDAVQTDAALAAIRFAATILPLLCFLAGSAFLGFYPIDRVLHGRMVEELRRRSGG